MAPGEARGVVAKAHQLAALLVGADEQRQVAWGRAVQLLGQRREPIGAGRVRAQEDGHAVGVAGGDPSQQPAGGLGALEGRQQLAQHRLIGQQRRWADRAPAQGRRTFGSGGPAQPLCSSPIDITASP